MFHSIVFMSVGNPPQMLKVSTGVFRISGGIIPVLKDIVGDLFFIEGKRVSIRLYLTKGLALSLSLFVNTYALKVTMLCSLCQLLLHLQRFILTSFTLLAVLSLIELSLV